MNVIDYIKGVVRRLFKRDDFKSKLKLTPVTSSDYLSNLELWFQIFQGNAPWVNGKVESIKLANFSTAYLAKLINAELKLEVTGSKRADYIQSQLDKYLLPNFTEKLQLALIGGQVIAKPIIINGQDVGIEFVKADQFYPLSFDITGKVTSGIFTDFTQEGDTEYIRLEIHQLEGTHYRVTNKAYVYDDGTIGREADLNSITEWAGLEPKTNIQNISIPLFACIKMPFVNSIDFSPLPVSIYAEAVQTLENIDKAYSDYCYELASAKRKIYVDVTAFQKDSQGRLKVPDRDMYVALNTDGTNKMFEDYTPNIRESEYANGINQLLRIYEAQTGVSGGTYSFDIKTGAVTATQVISEDRTTFYTVKSIQESARYALLDLIDIIDIYATLYQLAPAGEYEVVLDFGDSVFEDTQTEFNRRIQLTAASIMRPEELRAWYLGEDIETAMQNLPQMNPVLAGE